MNLKQNGFKFFFFLIPFFLFQNFLFALEVAPLINLRLLGGQYVFESQESNVSGNIHALLSPAISFNKQWSLIPSISSSWRGIKSVQELVGGGTLFQQTQDHAANLKGIFRYNKEWQFKAGGGYRIQLLKETKDEDWGDGLFDFRKASANLEAENQGLESFTYRLGYDFYSIDFNNFSSLESQKRELGRENVAAKTLNTNNHAGFITLNAPFTFINEKEGKAEVSYYFTARNFTDQKIVRLSGELSGDLRKDQSHMLRAEVFFPLFALERVKVLMEVKGAYSFLDSNQNNYDAKKTQFNSNYYSYRDISNSSNFNFLVGSLPYIFSSGFSYVRRNYSDRPVQDLNGNYGSGTVHLNEYYANFSFTMPLNKFFKFQLLSNFGWSRSNMKYEKTYRYNYHTFTYLAGILYEY